VTAGERFGNKTIWERERAIVLQPAMRVTGDLPEIGAYTPSQPLAELPAARKSSGHVAVMLQA
jgi:hypothetical protein